MKFSRRIRYLLIGIVVLALIAVAFWPQARLVDTAPVDRGRVRETVEAEGRTRLRDRYVISAPVAAIARRLELEPGDTVGAGQVLVVLDPVAAPTLDARSRASAEAAIAAAKARVAVAAEEVRSARAAATQAQAEARRLRELRQRGLVAVEDAERAETERILAERAVASARFAQATAEHDLEAAEAVLAYGNGSDDAAGRPALELTSPVDGVILRRHYESAKAVQTGEALLEVGDPAGLEIEVDVLSSDAVRLRDGMQVELVRWGEPQPLAARVQRIEPGGFTKFSALGVEEQRVWVIVDLLSPREEWRHLGEAYRVNARFILNEVDDAVRVPTGAVFTHDDGYAVFRIDGSRVRLTYVDIGLQGGGQSQIFDGVAPDERVVIHPDRELGDGDRVRPR